MDKIRLVIDGISSSMPIDLYMEVGEWNFSIFGYVLKSV